MPEKTLSAAIAAASPIVGVGASAGGLDAFTQLLTSLPADSGMAFVLIQHLDPAHKSLLGESLGKITAMPVSQARNGDIPLANHVYVMPPDADVSLTEGRLTLFPRSENRPQFHLPIDLFFTSLATERGDRSIGVVLSGTASDGTQGLKAIKAAGGITFAQDPSTAKFGGMPQSAVDADAVDFALPIAELARELLRIGRHPYLASAPRPPVPSSASDASASASASDRPGETQEDAQATLGRIMDVMRKVVGIDFRGYKSPTFERRLGRRMALRKIDERETYLRLLESDGDEVRDLCAEVLIHVSSFFRDPEVFAALRSTVFPEILKHKNADAPIRVWVAGCSTGQEVYSIAIALIEFLGESLSAHPLQVFGTDISDKAILAARAGQYAEAAMGGISEEQRRRFFTKVDGTYRINRSVRDLCVFVRHDLAQDPPFSRIDLLSCRNVLIYFDPSLQKRVLPTFHYGLNQPGFLLLGRTEHILGLTHLFVPTDKTHKIFTRSAGPSHLRFAPRLEKPAGPAPAFAIHADGATKRVREIADHLDRLLLGRYAPPGILINDKMEVLQFRGQTGAYLQPSPGEPQSNFVKMARPGLLPRVQDAVAQARRSMAPFRVEGVEVNDDGFKRQCDVVAIPFVGLPTVKEPLFLVVFEDTATSERSAAETVGDPAAVRVRPASSSRRQQEEEGNPVPRLQHELLATTQYLHSVIEEHARTNDDLGAANEELISGNEELQSLNEELETAKEELQSTNEELITVNEELHSSSIEVGRANSDLTNLIDTVDIAIIIVDRERKIRRFTPKAQSLLNVLPSDVGRSFDDMKLKIDAPDLDRQIADVIAAFGARESEVQDRDGRWYRLQLRPYKTTEGRIDGAIVSLVDIDELKRLVRVAEEARAVAESADQAKDEFLATLSHELRTPLSALLMQTQLMRRMGADPVHRERACDGIERSTRLQVRLIDDLLDVSRIVTGKMRVDLHALDFGGVVSAAVNAATPLADRKSIELRVFITPGLPPISGDRTRLDQVVSNLLGNAIKFTPNCGRVEVFLGGQDGPGGASGIGDMAHLSIRDNGIGIDPVFMPRIFNRLTQVDTSSTRAHSGLGLGLAIVRHLVEAHGGTVHAESLGVGHGSTFHVMLPTLRVQPTLVDPSSVTRFGDGAGMTSVAVPLPMGAQPETKSRPHAFAAARLVGKKIEIVEDDTGIREALAEILSEAGADVRVAESAVEGLALFAEFRPHGIVCDIAMPGEDGYSFMRKIRGIERETGQDTPALALTALAGEPHKQRAFSAGFQMYLVKPIDPDRLTVALADLLDGPVVRGVQ